MSMKADSYTAYSPEDVIIENLVELEERASLLGEQKNAHLCELAAEIVSGMESDTEWMHSLSDRAPGIQKRLGERGEATPDALERENARYSHTVDSLRLCRAICHLLSKTRSLSPSFFFSTQEEVTACENARIACQKSIAADDAFLRFSKLLSEPRIVYAPNFAAVCEEVAYGRCDYCILPMESLAEGRLNSFSRLIDRYGLRILLTTTPEDGDAMPGTRFALLGRTLATEPLYPDGGISVELSVPFAEQCAVEEILLAARLCGLRLEQMNAIPSLHKEGEMVFHPCFSADDADVCTFFAYLSMEATHCDVVGYYTNWNLNR